MGEDSEIAEKRGRGLERSRNGRGGGITLKGIMYICEGFSFSTGASMVSRFAFNTEQSGYLDESLSSAYFYNAGWRRSFTKPFARAGE